MRVGHQDFVLRNLDWVVAILESVYGTPDHANKEDPVDELIYIQLARRTHQAGYTRAYNNLRKLGSWERVASLPKGRLYQAIRPAGLGPKRTEDIQACLRAIKRHFGSVTLEPTRRWSNERLFRFLTNLPGVGAKSAYCVMMYSFKRRVFPADAHVITVCERLGVIPPRLNHKRAQSLLADLFPEDVRYSLHVNLLSHGQQTCLKRNPRCGECSIRKFCLYYRSKAARSPTDSQNTFADLFCGAGGTSLGLTRAGFAPKLMVDSNGRAGDTLYLNLSNVTPQILVVADIRTLKKSELRRFIKPTVLVAGMPCQGWSQIGKNNVMGDVSSFARDPRNLLYRHTLRALRALRPTFVLIENVPPLAKISRGRFAHRILRGLRRAGYVASPVLLDAMDFGVPQHRTRFFVFAVRVERGAVEAAKARLAVWLTGLAAGKVGPSQKARLTVGETLRDLPRINAGEGGPVLKVSDSQKKVKLVFNHEARRHNPRDLKLFRLLRPGENARHAVKKYGREDLMTYSQDNFISKYRKLRGDAPFPAIIAHLAKDTNSYVHPNEARGLTVREAARAQGFPDDFIFLGGRMQPFQLVGNAIPPPLAEAIALAARETLDAARKS